MTFAVDETVFSVMINYCVGLVIAEGVQCKPYHTEVEDMLAENMAEIRERMQNELVSQSPSIQPYREAYKRLGIDPEEYKSSIEYLLTQAARGRGIPMVNPITDLASAVSLKHLVPVGTYDIDAVNNRLEVRFSEEGDLFAPYGEEEQKEEVDPGEVVYASGNRVKARKWIWRQSEKGKTHMDTSRLLVSIDGFEGINKESVIAARDELASYLTESFNATVATGYLNYSHNAVTTATGDRDEG